MIDLKCCTVLVNNKAEYIALIKEAQKQGYTCGWNCFNQYIL